MEEIQKNRNDNGKLAYLIYGLIAIVLISFIIYFALPDKTNETNEVCNLGYKYIMNCSNESYVVVINRTDTSNLSNVEILKQQYPELKNCTFTEYISENCFEMLNET